jgi:hypothetical protein
MIQAEFIFSIALLSFADDADQLLDWVNVRRRPSRLDEVCVISLAPPEVKAPWAAPPIAEIRVRRHTSCCVGPAGFAWDPPKDRVNQGTQPSPHHDRSIAAKGVH